MVVVVRLGGGEGKLADRSSDAKEEAWGWGCWLEGAMGWAWVWLKISPKGPSVPWKPEQADCCCSLPPALHTLHVLWADCCCSLLPALHTLCALWADCCCCSLLPALPTLCALWADCCCALLPAPPALPQPS